MADTKSSKTQWPGWWLVIPGVAALGVLGMLVYGLSFGAHSRWSVFATALASAGAATLVGALAGFLFGIPRSPTTADSEHYHGNSNLEQVSDWLTKILVGVGLVQLGRAREALGDLGDNLKGAFGGTASSPVFALAVLFFYAGCGFLFVYLWARLYLPHALTTAEVVQQKVDETIGERDKRRTAVVRMVERQLKPEAGSPPSQAELDKAMTEASDVVRIDMFKRAEDHRRRYSSLGSRPDVLMVERSIPVFRALVAADPEEQHFRNRAELAFALKDSLQPRYAEAIKYFDDAIRIRDGQDAGGWKIFELTRALCRAALHPHPTDAQMAAITADLETARQDSYAQSWMEDLVIVFEVDG